MERVPRCDQGTPRSAGRGWGRGQLGWLIPSLVLSVLVLNAPDGTAYASDSNADMSNKKLILNGFRRYHSVCNHCHGPDGLGSSFGPSLIDEPPDEDAFKRVVIEGVKGPSGVMKGFAENRDVMQHLDAIYAYIAARASGELGRGRPR